MKRVVWKPKPAATTYRAPTEKDLQGSHRHGCTTCSATYEDSCASPLSNGQCTTCRGREAPLWERNLRPQECCTASRPATPAETNTYRLGGDVPWFICPACKRPHIYKPDPTRVATRKEDE